MVHRHGSYKRYADPAGVVTRKNRKQKRKERKERKGKNDKLDELESIQRYLCPVCGLTLSVLPPHRLPYRPLRADRLQEYFDQQAGIQTKGLDPPPQVVEAGCLQRAWCALTARVKTLTDVLGQLISKPVSDGASFWAHLRQSFDSVPKLLCFLSQHHHISLLRNYLCLQPPR
jgi:hypothetical protein